MPKCSECARRLKVYAASYRAGASLTRLAKAEGVSPQTLAARLRSKGVVIRGRGRPCVPPGMSWLKEALKLRDHGFTQVEIAARIGITRQAVSQAFQRAKLHRR